MPVKVDVQLNDLKYGASKGSPRYGVRDSGNGCGARGRYIPNGGQIFPRQRRMCQL
jgi:hypothetical protein